MSFISSFCLFNVHSFLHWVVSISCLQKANNVETLFQSCNLPLNFDNLKRHMLDNYNLIENRINIIIMLTFDKLNIT